MSHFPDGIVYVIVPNADLTEEMINNVKKDFNVIGNKTTNTCRESTDDPVRTLMKVKSPVSAVFNGYEWFNSTEIKLQLTDGTWD